MGPDNLSEDDEERGNFTEYLLAEMLLAQNPDVEITEAEFRQYMTALDHQDEVMLIEEAYDAIMLNYRFYEAGQIAAALDHALDTAEDYDAMDDVRRLSALHLDNLLSSARAFLDITPSHMKSLGGAELKAQFKALTAEQYDSNDAYRFMEALRNYTQHRGSSITTMTFDTRRNDTGNPVDSKEFKLIYSVRSGLIGDVVKGEFKAKNRGLVESLKDKNGKINITPLVRGYIVGLNAIILQTRELLKGREQKWLALNQSGRDRLQAVGASGYANAAIKRVGGRVVEKTYLNVRYKDRLDRLRKRNGKIAHLTKVQIAG